MGERVIAESWSLQAFSELLTKGRDLEDNPAISPLTDPAQAPQLATPGMSYTAPKVLGLPIDECRLGQRMLRAPYAYGSKLIEATHVSAIAVVLSQWARLRRLGASSLRLSGV